FTNGTAAQDSTGTGIVVTYSGTVCGVSVSGTENVKKKTRLSSPSLELAVDQRLSAHSNRACSAIRDPAGGGHHLLRTCPPVPCSAKSGCAGGLRCGPRSRRPGERMPRPRRECGLFLQRSGLWHPHMARHRRLDAARIP